MLQVFNWDKDKNQKLLKERGISFEAVISHIEQGDIIAIVPGRGRFSHQKQFLVLVDNYVYIVPFVENEHETFLKTIIPSRKLTKHYLRGKTT